MIKPLSLFELQQSFSGSLVNGNAEFSSVSTDTRHLSAGDLFVALKGEHFDGHNFLHHAVTSGACALVVSEKDETLRLPQWLVKDTTLALGNIAKQQRKNFAGKLVAITGSGGKTTVKEMLASIFFQAAPAAFFATQGNLNNHIGVPLSLLSLTQSHQYAVIEMGASAMGEIDYLTHLAKPHVALVNNVMPAHVEGFGSVDNIAVAKGEIYDGLTDEGIAVVNIDDDYAEQWLKKNNSRQIIPFSTDSAKKNKADIVATNISCHSTGDTDFDLLIDRVSYPVTLHVLGKHNVANALAAASCAFALGIDRAHIIQGLENFKGVDGRLQRSTGISGCTVIDDSYNANPGSMRAAVDVLASIDAQTILVVGDMGELGELAEQAHKDIGMYAKSNALSNIMAVGELSKFTVKGFGGGQFFKTQDELVHAAKQIADDNTVFLVKGSRCSRMDRVVSALMNNE